MSNIFTSALLFFVAATCFVSFSWGVKSHFRSTGKIPAGMKLVSLLSMAGFLGFTVRLAVLPLATHGLFAAALFTASLALFNWTINATRKTPPTLAFDTDKPVFLLLHGPYKYVRHPFYLSYMLFWTATAVAFSAALPWLTPLVMLTMYLQAASREERKFAHSDFSAAYMAYRQRAGMFIPRPAALFQG